MTAVIVIGGGFTGTAVAIALSRRAQTPLDIAVIEPRVEVGRGVAYSATDRDHRINAPAASHFVTADDAKGLTAGCDKRAVSSATQRWLQPTAVCSPGGLNLARTPALRFINTQREIPPVRVSGTSAHVP